MRAVVIATLWLLPASFANAQLFRFDGEVQSGVFYTRSEMDGSRILFEGYPVPYIGVFDYRPTSQFAAVDVEIDFGDGLIAQVNTPNLFDAIQTNDANTLEIDFESEPVLTIKTFRLSLDKQTGQGNWQWAEDCPTCDLAYPLPSQVATISSFRPVPEPGSLALLLTILGAASLAPRRDRRVWV